MTELNIVSVQPLLGQQAYAQYQRSFRYPPYIAEVKLQGKNYPGLQHMEYFLLIGLHAHLGSVAAELNALANLYTVLNNKHIQSQRNVQNPSKLNALILGDLNADGDYFTARQESAYKLRIPQFVWLTPRDKKTNVKLTKAYDRQVSIAFLRPK